MTYTNPTGLVKKLKCAVGSSASKTAYSSTTWTYVADSQVDYVPASDSEYVVYKYQFLANWSPDTNDLLQFKIMYDATASLDPTTSASSFTEFDQGFKSSWGGNQNSMSNLINLQFAIPAWSGVRRVVVVSRVFNTGGIGGTLHWTDKFRDDDIDDDNGAATAASFVFKPHYIIYSV